MYAQLGNIIFEGPKSFGSYQSTKQTNLVEHALIDGKPRLQKVGVNLEQLNISIQLHQRFCDVASEIEALTLACLNSEVMPLLDGTGLFIGNFVIKSVDKTYEHTDPQGVPVLAQLSLSLTEDAHTLITSVAQQDAFAAEDNNPEVVNEVPRTQGETANINKSVTEAKAQAGSVNADVSKASQNADQAAEIFKQTEQRLKKINTAANDVEQKLYAAKNAYQSTERIISAAQRVKNSAQAAITAVQSGNIDDIITANDEVQAAISAMFGANAELAYLSAIRKF